MNRPSALRRQLDEAELHERRHAVRALLVRPFLPAADTAFGHIRRHATWLRDWFAHETGWALHVDRAHARLRKTPVRTADPTRGARVWPGDPPFSRRRYVLACLALAALEAEDRQTALGRLAERILAAVAADPELTLAGVAFTLDNRDERRDLVAVVRLLIDLGILRRVDGEEAAYVGGTGDTLYTIDRPALAAVLATRRPPSTVGATTLDDRLAAITSEPVPDTRDARNRATRHRLTRRLLDDAVLAYDELDQDELAYLNGQRARILAAIEEATGLVPEIRAEGIAMVDPDGDATDLTMPTEGTDGHLALLLAETLATSARERPGQPVSTADLEARTRQFADQHRAYWRKDTRTPGAEVALTADAIARLVALDLAVTVPGGCLPRPAIGRYAVDEPTTPDTLGLFGADAVRLVDGVDT
jgi:uncharacterized protein (TIGR02678 family)